MSAPRRFKIALVGTDSLRAREIKNVLGRKKLKAFDLDFFDPDVEAEYGKLTEFKKEARVIHAVADERLSGKDLVFLASGPETNRKLGLRAAELGFRAIDLTETFPGHNVPLVVAGINDRGPDFERALLVANPHPATIILAHVFHLLRPKFGITKAVVFALQPASAFDDAGIQELASQSVSLLNGANPKKSVFKEQVAFNILSHTEAPDACGFGNAERRVGAELGRILGPPEVPLRLSVVQAPVFHTYSIMFYLEFARETDIAGLEEAFGESSYFKVVPSGPACAASPISVSGKDEIFVGLIKREPTSPPAFWIWVVADNLTRGSALNACDVARRMLEAGSR
jgi:aspartate-semialdehyde dehydrogenase